jgi:mannose-6-phosphate isomerase-like protein (cupin superfamily)
MNEAFPNYYREERPWGSFERFTLNEPSTVKIITVNPGEAFSLQTHTHRDERWRVLSGSGKITVGEEVKEIKAGDECYISRGSKHRAEAGAEELVFLEVATGKFSEEDITRIEDKYGRA